MSAWHLRNLQDEAFCINEDRIIPQLRISTLLLQFQCMKRCIGNITFGAESNIWPHEMETAKALALAGYDIVFVDRPGKQGERVADILMDGDTWEMKSPRSDSLKAIERNVKRARNQSPCVVLDSRRMRKVPDAAIERELRRCAKTIKGIRRLLLVGRHGSVTTIL